MEVLTDKKILTNKNNNGVQGAPTLKVVEYGDGVHHITKIELEDFIVGVIPAAAAALTLEPITPLYTLPAGVQLRSASYGSIGVTAVGTAVSPEIGLGTVAGDGSANATIGAAGATMEDILEGYVVATTVTHAEVESSAAELGISASGDVKSVFLNSAGTWNVDNAGNLTVSGTVVLVWDTLV